MPTSLCLIRLVLQPRQLEVMNSRLVLELLLLSQLPDRLVSASQTLSPSWMFMVTFRQLDLLRQEHSCMVMVRESPTYQVILCGFRQLLVFTPFQQMLVSAPPILHTVLIFVEVLLVTMVISTLMDLRSLTEELSLIPLQS